MFQIKIMFFISLIVIVLGYVKCSEIRDKKQLKKDIEFNKKEYKDMADLRVRKFQDLADVSKELNNQKEPENEEELKARRNKFFRSIKGAY